MYVDCTRTRPDQLTFSSVFHPSRQTAGTVRVQVSFLRTVPGQSADIPRLFKRTRVRGHCT